MRISAGPVFLDINVDRIEICPAKSALGITPLDTLTLMGVGRGQLPGEDRTSRRWANTACEDEIVHRRHFLGLTAGAAASLALVGVSGSSAHAVSIPRPTAFMATRWDSNPWARGSYSALSTRCYPGARETLSAAGSLASNGGDSSIGSPTALGGKAERKQVFKGKARHGLRSGRYAGKTLAEPFTTMRTLSPGASNALPATRTAMS